jgi:hypothetical protein
MSKAKGLQITRAALARMSESQAERAIRSAEADLNRKLRRIEDRMAAEIHKAELKAERERDKLISKFNGLFKGGYK